MSARRRGGVPRPGQGPRVVREAAACSRVRAGKGPRGVREAEGGDDAGDALKHLAAESLALHGEASALIVGQADAAAAELLTEDAILLQEVVDDAVLLAVRVSGRDR